MLRKKQSVGLQRCRWQYGSIFIRLALLPTKSAKYREILSQNHRPTILHALEEEWSAIKDAVTTVGHGYKTKFWGVQPVEIDFTCS